jgi:Domain of unknown function (DUF4262)
MAQGAAMPLNSPEFSAFQRSREPRPLTNGENHLAAVSNDITEFGWHIRWIPPEPGRIGWHYSIGFADTLGEPDVVVFGLDKREGTHLLNTIADELARERHFRAGARYKGYFQNVEIEFRATLPQWTPAHFGDAVDWYQEQPRMHQIVLPDVNNRFPGEDRSDASRVQMLLYSESPAPHYLTHRAPPANMRFNVDELSTGAFAELLNHEPTGWQEDVYLTSSASPGRWIICSVPFSENVSYGDEVEVQTTDGQTCLTAVTCHAPVTTLRTHILRNDDETTEILSGIFDACEERGIVWESPFDSWLFFGVPNEHEDWIRFQLERLVLSDRLSVHSA